MATVAYMAAVLLAVVLRALPLRLVAALGRAGGLCAWWLDRRHRKVALLNLSRCFPSRSAAERRATAREHFVRLGETYATAVTLTGMTSEELRPHLEVVGLDRINPSVGAVVAVGHFGNFEAYSRIGTSTGACRFATTYRALKQPKLDRLVRKLRGESGCIFFDRRRELHLLRTALRERRLILGLLCDQHAGSGGMRLPFLGHDCSVNTAPAIFASRYGLPLYTAICHRIGPAKWRVVFGDEIPTRHAKARRSTADIMLDVHAAFERAILADPPNWFWVHDRWRFMKGERSRPVPLPKQSRSPASA
jgi:Kdo2-lipid IVA lauroyltransferase/acyltransferase